MARRAGRHVALLRGINVGGKNKVPMKALAAMFEAAGCADVVTYIQSGNVVFGASAALARKIPGAISAAIEAELGLQIPVITRTAAEIAEAARHNPFPTDDPAEHRLLHVGFLRDRPRKRLVAALDPDRSPPDAFEVRGAEIYLHFPGGSARTKLTPVYFDRVLETIGTWRNWRTVRKLLELTGGGDG